MVNYIYNPQKQGGVTICGLKPANCDAELGPTFKKVTNGCL